VDIGGTDYLTDPVVMDSITDVTINPDTWYNVQIFMKAWDPDGLGNIVATAYQITIDAGSPISHANAMSDDWDTEIFDAVGGDDVITLGGSWFLTGLPITIDSLIPSAKIENLAFQGTGAIGSIDISTEKKFTVTVSAIDDEFFDPISAISFNVAPSEAALSGVTSGTAVTLSYSEPLPPGYTFKGWFVFGDYVNALEPLNVPLVLSITCNTNIVAVFNYVDPNPGGFLNFKAKVQYQHWDEDVDWVDDDRTGNATVATVDNNSGSGLMPGAPVSVTYTILNPAYEFVGWRVATGEVTIVTIAVTDLVNGDVSGSTLSFDITEDTRIIARFKEKSGGDPIVIDSIYAPIITNITMLAGNQVRIVVIADKDTALNEVYEGEVWSYSLIGGDSLSDISIPVITAPSVNAGVWEFEFDKPEDINDEPYNTYFFRAILIIEADPTP